MASLFSTIVQSSIRKSVLAGSSPQEFKSYTWSFVTTEGDQTFTRSSTQTFTDFEGLVKTVPVDQSAHVGARMVENLASGVETQSVTVVNGSQYAVTIKGDNGATAVLSNAAVDTLTADGVNRISHDNAIPVTASTNTLTITVTGSLSQLQVEDVTGQGVQAPSEFVDEVSFLDNENRSAVSGSGVVSEGRSLSFSEDGAIVDTGVLFEAFENAGQWANFGSTAAGHSVSDDSSSFKYGTQSVMFSANGAGTVRYNRYIAQGVDLSGETVFSMWVDWDRQNSANNITVYMSSDGNATFTNYVLITISASITGSTRGDGGPILLTWKRSDMTVGGGSIEWSNVTNLNILCNMAAGAETIRFDSLFAGRKSRPKVVVCFDDGLNDSDFSQVDAAGIALARGVPVSLFVIPRLIDADDGSNYITVSEALALQGQGHYIGPHSDAAGLGNYSSAGWTPDQVKADIVEQRGWCESKGFDSSHFAWPGGAYFGPGGNFIESARDAGLTSARSITGVVQTNNKIEKTNQGVIEPMVLNASSMDIGSGAETLISLKASVDEAIDTGATLFFYVHKISNGSLTPTSYEITGDDFAAVCDHIKTKVDAGLVDAETIDQWFAKASEARVRVESPGILLEPAATNLFHDSFNPATQTQTVAAVEHTLTIEGSGSITLSGVAAGAATSASPLTFTPAAGGLTMTVAGSVTKAQLETGGFGSSFIETPVASTATRAATIITRPWKFPKNGISGQIKVRPQFDAGDTWAGNRVLLQCDDGTGNNRILIRYNSGNDSILLFKILGGSAVTLISSSTALNYVKGDLLNLRFKLDSTGVSFWINDLAKLFTSASIAPSDFISLLNSIRAGSTTSGEHGNSLVESLRIWNEAKSDSFLENLT